MDNTMNAISWFEIPVVDMARARAFYENVFAMTMMDFNIDEFEMVVFPGNPEGNTVCGALMKHADYEPRDNGVMIYLNAEPDIQAVADRVGPAGGTLLQGKTLISEQIGYMCLFLDTEGNRVAAHSMN